MKYLDIKLVNYVGVYNGMHLNELYIDLSKAKHESIVIIGDNGGGKSTLMEALSILPDDNKMLIDGMNASKEITLQNKEIIYKIRFIHGWKNDKRETTKGYIRQIIGTHSEELNPNGNIRSFKEIVFEKLDLDPNFMALSYLSSTKKGLGAMTYSERKYYVNNIIKELSDYNNMYKVFSKRANSFKSIMNNLVNKINLIGDADKVGLTLQSLESRINKMMNDKDEYLQDLAEYKSKVKLLDPTGDIQNSYNDIYNRLSITNDELDKLNKDIMNSIISNLHLTDKTTKEDLINYNNDINKEYSDLEVSIKVNESNILSLLNDREKESKEIQEKITKLDGIKVSLEFENLDDLIKQEIITNNNYKLQLNRMNLLNSDISKEEYIIGLETLHDIKDIISIFKSDCEEDILQLSANFILENRAPLSIQHYDEYIDKVKEEIHLNEMEVVRYNTLKDQTKILERRPSNCKIDSCSFIENALQSQNEMNNIDINKIENDLSDLRISLDKLISDKENSVKITKYMNVFNNMIRDIRSHAYILKKLPIDSDKYINTNKLIEIILNGYDFKEIDDLYQNIQHAEIIELYKKSNKRLSNLQKNKELYDSKISIIDDITKDIDNLNTKLNELNKTIEEKNNTIGKDKNRLTVLNTLKMCFNNIFNMISQKEKLENEKINLLSSFNNIKVNMINIKESLDKINELTNKINYINDQIAPLMNDRDKLKFNLKQLEDYHAELEVFNEKYEKVNTFKKYSSPTKDGIQTLFIDMYMHQTLKLTNDVLSLLFDGEFVIGDFAINDNEFRIPVFGNGLPHDDISSMSNAQVSMISMIISFVLLRQSSSSYNILKLDELDSMLDTKNRLQFTYVLNKMREIMEVEQIFLISHNNEISLDESSIILLNYSEPISDDYDYIFRLQSVA